MTAFLIAESSLGVGILNVFLIAFIYLAAYLVAVKPKRDAEKNNKKKLAIEARKRADDYVSGLQKDVYEAEAALARKRSRLDFLVKKISEQKDQKV